MVQGVVLTARSDSPDDERGGQPTAMQPVHGRFPHLTRGLLTEHASFPDGPRRGVAGATGVSPSSACTAGCMPLRGRGRSRGLQATASMSPGRQV